MLTISSCATVSPPPVSDKAVAIEKPIAQISEDDLFDVWINLFEPGELPKDEIDALGISIDIRQAEARYMAIHLRDSMEKTGYWGAVRVVPKNAQGAEISVHGTILASNGEVLELEVSARDATGRKWFTKRYQASISTDVYANANKPIPEAFQSLYNTIANDLAQYRNGLRAPQIKAIRRIAELRFAQDLAPDAFASHLAVDDEGVYTIKRLPAAEDPMFQRIQAIRERDYLLIDTLNGHFDNFYDQMQAPYWQWRKARSGEAESLREIKRDAVKRKALGFAAIFGAIAIEVFGSNNSRATTGTLRDLMVLGGFHAVKTGYERDSDTIIHRDSIEELGDSFSAQAKPLVVNVEGETHELTGSAESQYAEWRKLLRRLYASETGLLDATD